MENKLVKAMLISYGSILVTSPVLRFFSEKVFSLEYVLILVILGLYNGLIYFAVLILTNMEENGK